MDNKKIIDFEQITDSIADDVEEVQSEFLEFTSEQEIDRQELLDLQERLNSLAENSGLKIVEASEDEMIDKYDVLSKDIDQQLQVYGIKDKLKFSKFPEFTKLDTTVSILTGLMSVLIDIFLVGTPIAKKQFEGSVFTEQLRKFGQNKDSDTAKILSWLSDKSVPYDISAEKGVVTPNNHRLRSLAHDPFFGLLFAVADILLDTTTVIDNAGKITILRNPGNYPKSQKFLPVIYYLGHIISDFYTARGIPIPGFFLTQFFTSEGSSSSIAKIAEKMYTQGYDLRHLGSMSLPVITKNIIVNVYLELIREVEVPIMGIADKEKAHLDHKLKGYKMKFYADAIGTSGNLVKFISPPTSGNLNAINIVQWMSLIKNGAILLVAANRVTSVEKVMHNRQQIDKKWEKLLGE